VKGVPATAAEAMLAFFAESQNRELVAALLASGVQPENTPEAP
jgi:hypothetical protein